jgi:predicted GNAT family N-acyltransferase
MNYKWINGKEGFEEAFKVRRTVFVEGQKVPESMEKDEFDEQAHHLLVSGDDIPIATGMLFYNGKYFKLGRICVLKQYRGMDIGRYLME